MREVKNAEEEGVEFVWLSAPEAFRGDTSVSGVRSVRMHLGLPDSSGRQSVEPLEGSHFTLEADLVHQGAGLRSRGPAGDVRRAGTGRQPLGHAQDRLTAAS